MLKTICRHTRNVTFSLNSFCIYWFVSLTWEEVFRPAAAEQCRETSLFNPLLSVFIALLVIQYKLPICVCTWGTWTLLKPLFATDHRLILVIKYALKNRLHHSFSWTQQKDCLRNVIVKKGGQVVWFVTSLHLHGLRYTDFPKPHSTGFQRSAAC